MTDKELPNSSPDAHFGNDLGTRITDDHHRADDAAAERRHIHDVMWTHDHPEIEFSGYVSEEDEDDEFCAYRMDIDTHETHIVPKDIDNITENTEWSFIGVQNRAVMFEGETLGEPYSDGEQE
jgi:hypothetical protein